MTRKPALTSAERKAPTCRPAPGFSSLHARGWPLPPCSAAQPSRPAPHRAHTPGSALDATPRASSPAPLLSRKGAKLDWDQAHRAALGPSAVWPSSSRPHRGSLWAVFPVLCSSRVKVASSRTEGPGEGCGQHHLDLLSRLKADSGSLRRSRPGPGAPCSSDLHPKGPGRSRQSRWGGTAVPPGPTLTGTVVTPVCPSACPCGQPAAAFPGHRARSERRAGPGAGGLTLCVLRTGQQSQPQNSQPDYSKAWEDYYKKQSECDGLPSKQTPGPRGPTP